MAKVFAYISVESDDRRSVEDAVTAIVGNCALGRGHFLGIHSEVDENPVEFTDGVELPVGVESDDDQFFQEFDLRAFRLSVDLWADPLGPGRHVIPVVADQIARSVSGTLKCRTVLFIDGHVPLFVYNNGRLIRDMSERHRAFLLTLPWCPSTLCKPQRS